MRERTSGADTAQVSGPPGIVWRIDAGVQRIARDSAVQAVPGAAPLARAINTWGGDGVIWFAALLWLGGRAIKRQAWAHVGLRGAEAIAIASAISGIIKGLAGRARPFLTPGEPWHWDFNHGWSDARYFSMPSGHTTATVAFAAAVVLATREWTPGRRAALIVPLCASAILVGVARIFTNQHWISDVIVANLLGISTALVLSRAHARADEARAPGTPSRYRRWMLGAGAAAIALLVTSASTLALLLATPNVAAAQRETSAVGRAWSRAFERSDAYVLGGAAATSVLLMRVDRSIGERVRGSSLQDNGFVGGVMDIAGAAGDPGTVLVSAGLWIGGRIRDDRTQKLVGLRALESVIVSGALNGALKGIAGRARPDQSPTAPSDWRIGRGIGDRSEYQSFASGHTTAVFAFASAVDAEWARLSPKRPRWVVPALYGLASLTAISRVYHDRHWASDVVMGSAIGFVGGRAVVRWHADRP
ncbi:MAG: phosphatase PAP2 family protein [Gemmatimonadota bacterium]|nr:phosphatase PAP2 family protein [Gemmatimonadota bacterium]